MLRRIPLLLALGSVFVAVAAPLAGCDRQLASADEKPAPKTPPPAARSKVELDAASAPARVVLTYLDVHKSLAGDAFPAAKERFATLATAIADKAAVTDDALRARCADAARAGAQSKDIAAARKAFEVLSRALLDWLRVQPNPLPQPLHVANCPMAFDSGAKWLQASDKVENPYYGAEMFTCGSIDAKLAPGEKLSPR